MNNSVWGFVVLLVVLTFLLPAAAGAFDNAARTATVDNETIVVDYDDGVPVDEGGFEYFANETVTVNNTTLSDDDYSFSTESGQVYFNDTAATQEGDEANISYAYRFAPEQVGFVAQLVAFVGMTFPFLLVLAGGIVAVGWVASYGRGGGI